AFAWNPVRGATCYEFELATSRTFNGNSIAWSNVPTNAHAGKFCGPVKFTMYTAPIGGQTDKSSGSDGSSGDSGTPQKTTTTTVLPAIRIPALSLNLTLPWFTGKPYALYAHVRAVTTRGPTAWSAPFGFNMRWDDPAVPMQGRAGL